MDRLTNPPPHIYAGQGFDRAAPRRQDEAWLAERRAHPGTRLLLMAELEVMIDEAAPRPMWRSVEELGREVPETAVFLGVDGEVGLFAVDLEMPAPAGGRYVELRTVGAVLPAQEAGLCAYARALAVWHGRHRFCGVCGGPTESRQGGHMRRCEACGAQHFPRSDPAVIVLVIHTDPSKGERCLLGHSPRFPEKLYSTLAGFVEPGESLEETARREIFEEAGVELFDLSYRSSQPWPFPASLMLGFRARARSDALNIDQDELLDAGWFARGELQDPERRPIKLPNPDSIARHLIEDWLAEGN